MENHAYIEETRKRHALRVHEMERIKRDIVALESRLKSVELARDAFAAILEAENEAPGGNRLVELSKAPVSAYHNMKVADMLDRFAESHGEPVKVTEAAKEFVREGLWPTVSKARDSIHPTLRVLVKQGKWRKIGEWRDSVYERVRPTHQVQLNLPTPATNSN